jgi:hypothetical protein
VAARLQTLQNAKNHAFSVVQRFPCTAITFRCGWDVFLPHKTGCANICLHFGPTGNRQGCAGKPALFAGELFGTRRAHENSMTGITIEHTQFIEWAQTRGGRPVVKRPSAEAALPQICFSQEEGEVSWDEWMSVFDHGEWAFIYQDRTYEGELSRTCRIIPRFAPEQRWTCELKFAARS